jgi:dTDP-6-deoxy-L-talose 4-dehydrogenase (NAD+)
MLIVVSGASGFLGQEVCKVLLKNPDLEVIGLTRKLNTLNENPQIRYLEDCLGDSIEYVIPKSQSFILIHLAWEESRNYQSDIQFEQIEKHEKFLNQMVQAGCNRIIVSGTCFEYFEPNGRISENATLRANTKYAAAKIELHEKLIDLALKEKISLIWLRLFYMYGPNQNNQTLIGSLMESISESKEVFRVDSKNRVLDYSHVSELAEKICAISLKSNVQGTFNVASGHPTSVGELVNKVANSLGSKIRIHDRNTPSQNNFWADTSKYDSLF